MDNGCILETKSHRWRPLVPAEGFSAVRDVFQFGFVSAILILEFFVVTFKLIKESDQ
jgi:hypothetical protein